MGRRLILRRCLFSQYSPDKVGSGRIRTTITTTRIKMIRITYVVCLLVPQLLNLVILLVNLLILIVVDISFTISHCDTGGISSTYIGMVPAIHVYICNDADKLKGDNMSTLKTVTKKQQVADIYVQIRANTHADTDWCKQNYSYNKPVSFEDIDTSRFARALTLNLGIGVTTAERYFRKFRAIDRKQVKLELELADVSYLVRHG